MTTLLDEAGSLRLAGRLAEAEGTYRQAIAAGAPVGAAHYGLGLTLKASQRTQEALMAFQEAAKDPAAPLENYTEAGILTTALGRPDLAMGWIKLAADRYPARYEPPFFLGAMLANAGRDADALTQLRRAADLNGTNSEIAQTTVGVLRRLHMGDDALYEATRWLRLTPTDPAAHAALAHIHLDRNRPDEAEGHARRAAELVPNSPDAAILHARVLVLLERIADAKTVLVRARALAPQRADIYVHLGNLLKIEGRITEARGALRQALALAPANAEAFFELSEITQFEPGDPLVASMDRLAEAAKDQAPPQLHFALGKAYDDTNETARAFQHFAAANAVEHAVRRYDEPAALNTLERLQEIFSSDFVRSIGAQGYVSDLPVLIVGMPRSGSTLVEQILASHPDVAAGGERLYLRQAMDTVLAARVPSVKFPDNLARLSADDFGEIGRRYIEKIQQFAHGRRRVTDKLLANGLLAGVIRAALPGARIIHCVREPLDTCLSAYMKSFGQRIPYATDLGSLGRYYRAQETLMAHWRAVLPATHFLEVRYEDVVADQEGQARRLVAFCGLDWTDACLDFYKNNRPINTASVAQVREPVHGTSVGRWRRYAVQLQPLIAALKDDAA